LPFFLSGRRLAALAAIAAKRTSRTMSKEEKIVSRGLTFLHSRGWNIFGAGYKSNQSWEAFWQLVRGVFDRETVEGIECSGWEFLKGRCGGIMRDESVKGGLPVVVVS
jgi:hypothetical protein